jgi:hypothetical protein
MNMARKVQGRKNPRNQRYAEGGIMDRLRKPYKRRAKRDELVGRVNRRKQDQRKLAAAKDPKASTKETMRRMKEYKEGVQSEYKSGGKVKGYKKGGMVCRGGGAATRGLGFTRNG